MRRFAFHHPLKQGQRVGRPSLPRADDGQAKSCFAILRVSRQRSFEPGRRACQVALRQGGLSQARERFRVVGNDLERPAIGRRGLGRLLPGQVRARKGERRLGRSRI